jgi:hypothetical protein
MTRALGPTQKIRTADAVLGYNLVQIPLADLLIEILHVKIFPDPCNQKLNISFKQDATPKRPANPDIPDIFPVFDLPLGKPFVFI